MKIITSDEVGQVKTITISSNGEATTATIGTVNRNKSIHKIIAHNNTVLTINRYLTLKITVARADGSIDVMGTNGTQLQSYHCPMNPTKKHKWIGLVYHSNFLVALLNSGHGFIIDIAADQPETEVSAEDSMESLVSDSRIEEFQIGQDALFAFRMHGTELVFATGGEERELHVWDASMLPSTHKLELIFKATNVKNDQLDMRQKIWIRDIQFITRTRIAVITEYKHIRLYDILVAKRPFLNIVIGNNPLRTLATTETYAVIGDNSGQIYKFGYAEKTMIGKYQGCTGSVVQLLLVKGKVVCVALDRFMRVFGKDRHEEQKVYTKQRMSGICVIADENDEVSESDGENVWDELEVEGSEEEDE